MAREKEGYRENLELITRKIEERFPNSMGMLTTEQVAEFLNCTVQTVINNIKKNSKPLPAVNIASGKKRVYRIPVTGLARWILS